MSVVCRRKRQKQLGRDGEREREKSETKVVRGTCNCLLLIDDSLITFSSKLMSHSMDPDNGQGVWRVVHRMCVCHQQTGCCVAAVNEMGGYQGKQASLSPV